MTLSIFEALILMALISVLMGIIAGAIWCKNREVGIYFLIAAFFLALTPTAFTPHIKNATGPTEAFVIFCAFSCILIPAITATYAISALSKMHALHAKYFPEPSAAKIPQNKLSGAPTERPEPAAHPV